MDLTELQHSQADTGEQMAGCFQQAPGLSRCHRVRLGGRDAWWPTQHLLFPQANMTESGCVVKARPSLLE